jgi:peptidoglycan/xylan/chitin deacetylase (PgdA/CDA1 family)
MKSSWQFGHKERKADLLPKKWWSFGNHHPPESIVLLYHRVADLRHDPQALSVSPTHFKEHMEILKKGYSVLSLGGLLDCVHKGKMPKKAVVITFDDGYADNLTNGKSILQNCGIPATVFIATGYIDGNREFWWDEVERICFETKRLPEELSVRIDGKEHRWSPDGQSTDGEDCFERYRHWTVLAEETPTARHHLYKALIQVLRPLSHEVQSAVLDQLSLWAGTDRKARDTHRTLSEDDVLRLVDGGLIDVGAHAVNHDCLSSLPVSLQESKINESKARIEELIQRDVISFSYPYGTIDDFSQDTKALVKEAGFLLACTTTQARVTPTSDLFELPRFLVRNWPEDQFTAHLEEWYPR